MSTTRETVLAALHARLQPLAALALRDEVLGAELAEELRALRAALRKVDAVVEQVSLEASR